MTTETLETQAGTDLVDQSKSEAQTETQSEETEERAAEAQTEDAASVQQLEVKDSETPAALSREDIERLIEERAERIRQDAVAQALEADRAKRQTENARKAQQEQRDREDMAELLDTAKAAFGAAGVFEIPEDVLSKAVSRMVQKRTGQIARTATSDVIGGIEPAWDYLVGKSDELPEEHAPLANAMRPKMQSFVDLIREKAREGYIPESDVAKRIDDAIAARAAKSREGQEDIKRVEGAASAVDNSDDARLARINSNTFTADDRTWWNERYGNRR